MSGMLIAARLTASRRPELGSDCWGGRSAGSGPQPPRLGTHATGMGNMTDLDQAAALPAEDATGQPELDQVSPGDGVHYLKLAGLLSNAKLGAEDRRKLEEESIPRYRQWKADLEGATGVGDAKVAELVRILNEYKTYIELDLIWDSTDSFLYRQKGQLKIDNSIIEEFLPYLIDVDILPDLASLPSDSFEVGPRSAFSSAYFAAALTDPSSAGLRVRAKDQDFALGRPAYLMASLDVSFPASQSEKIRIFQAFVAAECKTNLDKTMFQEANATAHDLKMAIAGSKYYLLCEWLDMTPLSTAGTDIDEVIILRGKRPASNVRKNWADASVRQADRTRFQDFLQENPIRVDSINRLVKHIEAVVSHTDELEEDVLVRGYF